MASGQWEEFQNNPGHTIGSRYGRLGSPDYTWIGNFVRILFDGIDESDIAHEIDIICFNYDRCIEVYLAEGISAAFGMSLAEALVFIENRINIIHPYGYLGPVAKHPELFSENSIGYGYNIDGTFDVERISRNIRTYTERIDDVSVIRRIHAAMSCNVLVFLGFGFNNQNMNLLRLRGNTVGAEPTQIYVSGYGFERQVESTLIRRIGDLWGDGTKDHKRWSRKIHIEFGETARRLFEIHHPNLSSFSVGYIDEVTGDLIMDRKRD